MLLCENIIKNDNLQQTEDLRAGNKIKIPTLKSKNKEIIKNK